MNWELLNRTDYSKPRIIKNALRNMTQLERLAEKGDQVAAAILIDLRNAMNRKGVLAFRQKKFLQLWLDGYKQIEIATMYRMEQYKVSRIIDRCAKNISMYLRKGCIFFD